MEQQARIDRIMPYEVRKRRWRVVIETPKGSRNKYRFDEELGLFVLGGVLPEGMSFPYDFGYLPATLGEDGDPLDVLLLMDEPAFCGCIVPSRLIGVIEAKQTEKDGKPLRNDRLVAVSVDSRTFGDCKSLKDLSGRKVDEIAEFFVSYNRVKGKTFKVLAVAGPGRAKALARKGMTALVRESGNSLE